MKKFAKKRFVLLFLFLTIIIVGLILLTNRKNSIYPTTKPDYSSERTIQENNGLVTVNFAKCTPDIRRIDVTFGSTTIEIGEKEGSSCLIFLGGEVENPKYDGRLGTRCIVPSSLGTKEFSKGQIGVDTSSLQQYCSQI